MTKKYTQELNRLIEKIAILRIKKGISQKELSLKIGKNPEYIHTLETKKNFAPNFETLLDILEVFNIDLTRFFYEPFDDYLINEDLLTLINKLTPDKKEALKLVMS